MDDNCPSPDPGRQHNQPHPQPQCFLTKLLTSLEVWSPTAHNTTHNTPPTRLPRPLALGLFLEAPALLVSRHSRRGVPVLAYSYCTMTVQHLFRNARSTGRGGEMPTGSRASQPALNHHISPRFRICDQVQCGKTGSRLRTRRGPDAQEPQGSPLPL